MNNQEILKQLFESRLTPAQKRLTYLKQKKSLFGIHDHEHIGIEHELKELSEKIIIKFFKEFNFGDLNQVIKNKKHPIKTTTFLLKPTFGFNFEPSSKYRVIYSVGFCIFHSGECFLSCIHINDEKDKRSFITPLEYIVQL
jgi:hypothetical protein